MYFVCFVVRSHFLVPRMNIKTLLPELRKLVTDLAEDRCCCALISDAEIDTGLRAAFHQIERGGPHRLPSVWRDDYLDQVAVAWVLACVCSCGSWKTII